MSHNKLNIFWVLSVDCYFEKTYNNKQKLMEQEPWKFGEFERDCGLKIYSVGEAEDLLLITTVYKVVRIIE